MTKLILLLFLEPKVVIIKKLKDESLYGPPDLTLAVKNEFGT